MLLTKTRIQGCTVLGSKAMHLRILARAWQTNPEVEVLQHVEHALILLNLIRSFLLLVILEAANHGEAVEHVGVRELVDIEGEHEGDQAQAVPLVYMHPLVGSMCHHDL